MIKNRFLAAVMAVLAGLSVFSCDELQEVIDTIIEVSISADSDAFDANGEAVVKLSLNAPSNKNIDVVIGVLAEAQSGFTAVSGGALEYDGTVTIPAGTDLYPVTIKLNDQAQAGQQAVITIVSATGATVGKNSTVYLKVPSDYGKEENPNGNNEDPTKPELAGANVWSIIGAFNSWAGDLELTKTADSPETWVIYGCSLGGEFKFRGNKEWGEYDLGAVSGAVIVFGEPLQLVHKGQNITIAQGVYDIVLYPTEFKAVFSEVETPPSVIEPVYRPDWSGSLYMPSYTSTDGDNYAVIKTEGFADTDYYDMWYFPVPAEGVAGLDIEACIAESKDAIDEAYAYYNGKYDYTDFLYYGESYWLVYPEVTEPGDYVVFFVGYNADGSLTYNYGYSTFSYEETPTVDVTANLRSDWFAKWDGWDAGHEGETFWVSGSAPGADYVFAQWYTDEEIAEFFGDINGMVAEYASQVQDLVSQGYSPSAFLDAVASDGTFEVSLDTYDEVGPVNVYILGFSADGSCPGDYGVSEVVIPEFEKPVVEWVEQSGWKVAYDSSIDTQDPKNPYAIVVTACDAAYFDIVVGGEGALEHYGGIGGIADVVGDWSGTVAGGYSMDELLEWGYVGSADTLPFIYPYDDLEEGDELYVFGYDASGAFTGAWAMGIAENVVHPDPLEMVLQDNWSVNIVGSVYVDEYDDDVIDVVIDAPGIKYYVAEENTQEDLDYYYGGTVSGLAEYKQEDIELYQEYLGYTIEDLVEGGLLFSADSPMPFIYVYNTDVETTIYLVEFDQDGIATGRYGATNVVIPAPTADGAPAKAKKVKVRVNNKPAVSRKPVFEPKKHSAAVNAGRMEFGTKNAAKTFSGTKVAVKR